MDLEVDLPVHVGPVQLIVVLVCIAGIGASLIQALGQHWAARRQVSLGLQQKKSMLSKMGVGFAAYLGVLAMDAVGEFPWPTSGALASLSSNDVLSYVTTAVAFGAVGVMGVGLSKHASHHNH